jgi:hypothetical protein
MNDPGSGTRPGRTYDNILTTRRQMTNNTEAATAARAAVLSRAEDEG